MGDHFTGESALASASHDWLEEFKPVRFLGNNHLQTIAGNFIRRRFALPVAEPWFLEVEAATADRRSTELRCDCWWQSSATRRERPTVLIVHGLEGSSQSKYVLGNAARMFAAGWNVVAMNMRSCGGTEHLSPGIYHSGLSGDVARVVQALVWEHGLDSIGLVGYSMGGNLVFKYLGESAQAIPTEVRAAVGVSPLMDLAPSSAALHQPQNRLYEWRFLREMLRRMRRKAILFPEIYTSLGLERIRSMRDFDEFIVARFGGFTGASDYYAKVASSQFASQIQVPSLILHASDDPFIRMLPQTREALLQNPAVTLVETNHGGHCAFLSQERGSDRYWAEKALFLYLEQRL